MNSMNKIFMAYFMENLKYYRIVCDSYPDEVYTGFQKAYALKRAGHYDESLTFFLNFFNTIKEIDLILFLDFYKVLVADLDLSIAQFVIKGSRILISKVLEVETEDTRKKQQTFLLAKANDHYSRLLNALNKACLAGNKNTLFEYAKSLSGNINWECTKTEEELNKEVINAYDLILKI